MKVLCAAPGCTERISVPPDGPFPAYCPQHGGRERVYLSRLARLLRLQQDYRDDLNDLGMALLRRGITATLADCRDAGLEDEAELMITGGVA